MVMFLSLCQVVNCNWVWLMQPAVSALLFFFPDAAARGYPERE